MAIRIHLERVETELFCSSKWWGDPDFPINEGSLCAKGASLWSMYPNKHRPTKPMYRAPYSDKWVEKDWDWTLDRIAHLVKEARDKDLILKNEKGQTVNRSDNGLIYLDKYINAFLSLKVEQYVDLDSHGMFLCSIEEAQVTSKKETMTYTYYQEHVKPKPNTENKKGWVCKVCGYIYEGEDLPEDFVCPLCKHGAGDFAKIQ